MSFFFDFGAMVARATPDLVQRIGSYVAEI
jgi:hypothetical protein